MADLDALLLANEAVLKHKVSEEHRIEIAKRVGDAWESLATFIGVSNVEVNDIKDEYRKPLDRRFAMMRRWHELWGSEATYLRLMEGLKQIGRRDLIELLLCIAKDYHRNQQCWQNLCLWFAVLLGAATSLMILVSIFRMVYFGVSDARYQTLGNTSSTRQHFAEDITTHPHTIKALNHFNYRTLSNCSFPDNDLPIIHPLFVGRENDMQQVFLK